MESGSTTWQSIGGGAVERVRWVGAELAHGDGVGRAHRVSIGSSSAGWGYPGWRIVQRFRTNFEKSGRVY
jgi:hypothetical protein